MKFNDALDLMLQGNCVRLPEWTGYWSWQNDTIQMHLKNGTMVKLTDTEQPLYTFRNIGREDFELVEDVKKLEVATFTFSDALRLLKAGKSVRLKHWGKDVFITMQVTDKHSKMTHNYLYVTSRFGLVPWTNTQPELLSNDWEIYRSEN